jgi:hypothetical protein
MFPFTVNIIFVMTSLNEGPNKNTVFESCATFQLGVKLLVYRCVFDILRLALEPLPQSAPEIAPSHNPTGVFEYNGPEYDQELRSQIVPFIANDHLPDVLT